MLILNQSYKIFKAMIMIISLLIPKDIRSIVLAVLLTNSYAFLIDLASQLPLTQLRMESKNLLKQLLKKMNLAKNDKKLF